MSESDSPSTRHSLLELLASPRNEAAWCEFVNQYRPFLHKRCRAAGLHGHDADEVTGRVLNKLVVAFRRFCCDPSLRFRGYLSRVVRNEVRDYWDEGQGRRGGRGTGDPATQRLLEEIPAPVQAMADEVDESIHQNLACLHRVLNEVRPRVKESTWQSFWRTTFDGRPPQEVAQELGLSVAQVYVNKSRVLQMLGKRALELHPELAQRQGEQA